MPLSRYRLPCALLPAIISLVLVMAGCGKQQAVAPPPTASPVNAAKPASADTTVRPLTTPNSRPDQQRQNAATYAAYMAQHSGRPEGQTAPAR